MNELKIMKKLAIIDLSSYFLYK